MSRLIYVFLLCPVVFVGCSGKTSKDGGGADDGKNRERLEAMRTEGKIRSEKDEKYGGESWIVMAAAIPDALPLLKSVPNMTTLSLSGYAGDEAMEHIGKIKSLHDLGLELKGHSGEETHKGLTDDGLTKLKGLDKLEKLTIRWCHDFSKELKGLAALAELAALKELNLMVGYTDASLDNLKGCKQIRKLNLGAIDLTEKGAKHLLEMTDLEELTITSGDLNRREEPYTDWIVNLQKLPKLKVLKVDAPITPINLRSPLNQLKKARPDLKVETMD